MLLNRMILSQQNMVNEIDKLDEPWLTKITNVLLSDQINRMPCVALKWVRTRPYLANLQGRPVRVTGPLCQIGM